MHQSPTPWKRTPEPPCRPPQTRRSSPLPTSVPDGRRDRRRWPRRRRIGRVHARYCRRHVDIRPGLLGGACRRGIAVGGRCRFGLGQPSPASAASAAASAKPPPARVPPRARAQPASASASPARRPSASPSGSVPPGWTRPRHRGAERRPSLHRQPRAGVQGHLPGGRRSPSSAQILGVAGRLSGAPAEAGLRPGPAAPAQRRR